MKEQFIHVDEFGNKFYHADRKMELLTRDDGPAIEYADGSKEWWINGDQHREDGPACEYVNGSKEWWVNGELHRPDGPAIEYANGFKGWYIDGEYLSEEEFNVRMNLAELTPEELTIVQNVSQLKI